MTNPILIKIHTNAVANTLRPFLTSHVFDIPPFPMKPTKTVPTKDIIFANIANISHSTKKQTHS